MANTLYTNTFIFHFGDGVSYYYGYFFDTYRHQGDRWVVIDQFGRRGYGETKSSTQIPAGQTADGTPTYSDVYAQDGTLTAGTLLQTDPYWNTQNVYLLPAHVLGQTIGLASGKNGTRAINYAYAGLPTTTEADALSGQPITFLTAVGTRSSAGSGVFPTGAESGTVSVPGGAQAMSAQHFPAYTGYDVLYYYTAKQTSGWEWSGVAADNGQYGYYVDLPAGQYGGLAAPATYFKQVQLAGPGSTPANTGRTTYDITYGTDFADTPNQSGIADIARYPVGSVLIGNTAIGKIGAGGYTFTPPVNIGQIIGDLFGKVLPAFSAPNPLELGKGVATVAIANQTLKDLGGQYYVGTKGLGAEIIYADAALSNPAAMKALDSQNRPIGLHVQFAVTPDTDATYAMEQAILAALNTTTLYDFRFTYADGSYYTGTVADNGLFLYGSEYAESHLQRDGATGRYDITGSEGTTSQTPGTITLRTYVDAAHGGASYAVAATTQYPANGALGSEIGQVVVGAQTYFFGQGSYELSPLPLGRARLDDLNGDGRSDILAQGDDGSVAAGFLGNGLVVTGIAGIASPGAAWHLVGSADLDGDGQPDLVFQNTDGRVEAELLNGTAVRATGILASPGASWHVRGIADFTNDGRADVLLQNTDGSLSLVVTAAGGTAGTIAPLGNFGAAWHVEGTGDFDGDGTQDALLQNDDGRVGVVLQASLAAGVQVLGNPGPGATVAGTGDYNGDGKADVLVHAADGTVLLATLSGATVTGLATVGNPGAAFTSVLAGGDHNGDGKLDVAVQSTDSTVAAATLDGTSNAAITAFAVLGQAGAGFRVVGNVPTQFIDGAAAGTVAATPGADAFLLSAPAAGVHTVTGFDPVLDRVVLSKAAFGSYAAVQAAETASASGTTITLGNATTLQLVGVPADRLQAGNFAFA